MVRSNTPGARTSHSSASAASSPAASPRPSTDVRPSLDNDSGRESPAVDIEERVKGPAQPGEITLMEPEATRTSDDFGFLPRDSEDLSVLPTDDTATMSTVEGPTDVRPDIDKSTKSDSDETQSSVLNQITQNTATGLSEHLEEGSETPDATIAQLQAEHKTAESYWQEEMHGYIERIDALQSKLKYLARDAAESAKKAAVSAEPGSVEKQLREKDEKIALLLDEGQKLSKSEMEHRTAIKKLRQQLVDNSKSQTEAKKKTNKLERDLANAEARAQRAEAAEKRANDSLLSHAKVSRDMEAVTSERNALNETIQEMKAQLVRAVARAEAAESKAQSDALEKEKRQAAQLEEELSSAKTEREINEEKLNREINDLKEKVEQEKGRARMLEAELKGEQSVLESKMESLRSKAEEASSGAAGESQAKLLRQIETLQSQYSVASENWQTLEGSLLSRLANLEKERDDVSQREGEMRRKIREVVRMIVSRSYMGLISYLNRILKQRKQKKNSKMPKKQSKTSKASLKDACKICKRRSNDSRKLSTTCLRLRRISSSKRKRARPPGPRNWMTNAQDGANRSSPQHLLSPTSNPETDLPAHTVANQ